MKRRSGKRKTLVIDASVIFASKDSNAREASNCFNFLETVRKCKHKIIITPELDAEIIRRRNQSKKSKPLSNLVNWLSIMEKNGRVIRKRVVDTVGLRKKIRSSADKEILCKLRNYQNDEDVHLLEAALQTHKIVASLDDNARKCFASVCQQVRDIKDIMWVNPKEETEMCCDWLNNGAPVQRKHKLYSFRFIADR